MARNPMALPDEHGLLNIYKAVHRCLHFAHAERVAIPLRRFGGLQRHFPIVSVQ